MAGPEDEIAARAAGRGHLRASRADREQVISALKAAFVLGMLDRDEFGRRVDRAFAARTYADLAAVTGDIPARPIGTQPQRTPARARSRKPIDKRVKVAAQVACLSIPQAVLVAAFFLTGNGAFFVLSVFYFALATSFAGALMVEAWEQKRSRGQVTPPRAPRAGGQASRRLPPADPGRELPPAGRGDRHVAETARSRRRHRRRLCAGAALRPS
ncbi:MAG TPA: DUF1707 domain-containing protein [Streptosporangiaceae bacterium]